MALFGFGKKKKEETPSPQPDFSVAPTDQVLSMRQQGLTNNQIIQNLQRDGYQTNQIFDAMNQADMMTSVQQTPPEQLTPEQLSYPGQNTTQQETFQQPLEPQPPPVPEAGLDKESVEEIVEAIIDEKWQDLVKDINKVIEWKNKMESKINHIEQRINDLKDNFDKLHKALISKIGEYDQNILNVGTEIKAMEKVFQKILPTFTENVNELSRITKGIKSTPLKKK
jgi:uncharacterized protein YoxC